MNSGGVVLFLVGLCLSIQAAPTLRQPSEAFRNKKVHLTFFEHADFRGTQQNYNIPTTSTHCYNLKSGLSSVKLNNPVSDATCIVLFARDHCRGTKDGFVFTENATLEKLNDKLSSFRLCNDKDNWQSTFQNFARNSKSELSAETAVPEATKNVETTIIITNPYQQPELSSTVSTPVPEVTLSKQNAFSRFLQRIGWSFGH